MKKITIVNWPKAVGRLFDIQITKGNTAAPYEPFLAEPIDTIEIPIEEIKAIEGVEDVGAAIDPLMCNGIYKINDRKYFIQTCKELVLTGDEPYIDVYSYNGMRGVSIMYILDGKYNRANAICTDTTKTTSGDLTANSMWVGANNNSNLYWIGILDSLGYLSTIEHFRNFLARRYAKGYPVRVLYRLATPKVTDITDVFTDDMKLKVQSGGTIRFVEKNGMSVKSTISYVTRRT